MLQRIIKERYFLSIEFFVEDGTGVSVVKKLRIKKKKRYLKGDENWFCEIEKEEISIIRVVGVNCSENTKSMFQSGSGFKNWFSSTSVKKIWLKRTKWGIIGRKIIYPSITSAHLTFRDIVQCTSKACWVSRRLLIQS